MAQQSRNIPVRRQSATAMPSPFWGSPMRLWSDLNAEMDRVFNSMMSASMMPPLRGRPSELAAIEPMPAVDVIDKEKEIVVRAELPGIDEKDVDVQLSDGTLRIRGERREEREEGEEGEYYVSELRYGQFQRTLSLPPNIDRDAVSANFKNGILTVKLPKTKEAQSSTKKIEVKTQTH